MTVPVSWPRGAFGAFAGDRRELDALDREQAAADAQGAGGRAVRVSWVSWAKSFSRSKKPPLKTKVKGICVSPVEAAAAAAAVPLLAPGGGCDRCEVDVLLVGGD